MVHVHWLGCILNWKYKSATVALNLKLPMQRRLSQFIELLETIVTSSKTVLSWVFVWQKNEMKSNCGILLTETVV